MANVSSETMGNVSSETEEDFSEYEQLSMEDVPEYIEKHGLTGIANFFKEKLQQWKNVKITIGVTGDSGVGKSSFINAIRG
jgi:putative ribosome biogenesis GTPase RsgA